MVIFLYGFQGKRHSLHVSLMATWPCFILLSKQPGFNSQPRLHAPQATLFNTCKEEIYLCYMKAPILVLKRGASFQKRNRVYFSLFSVGNVVVVAFQQNMSSHPTKSSFPCVFIAACATTCFSHKEKKNAGIRDSNYMFLQTELTRKCQIAWGSI